MTGPLVIRVDLSEIDGAMALLIERGTAAGPAEFDRLLAAVNSIQVRDPEWIALYQQGGALHVVPGPKLLELIEPMDRVRTAFPAPEPISRWRRFVVRARLLVREVLRR